MELKCDTFKIITSGSPNIGFVTITDHFNSFFTNMKAQKALKLSMLCSLTILMNNNAYEYDTNNLILSI